MDEIMLDARAMRTSAALLLCVGAGCSDPAPDRRVGAVRGPRAVILISLDTLRPDRLGLYGGPEGNSPRIDALAREAVVFQGALAPSPWTLPSHMSLLSGLDPVAHGVRRDGYRLSPHVVTLAEELRSAGFRTAAFTDGGFVAGRFGFDQGFEVYRDRRSKHGPNGFTRLLPEALQWLRDHRDEDYFVFLHSFDAHGPYREGDEVVRDRFRQRGAPDGPDDWALHQLRFLTQQVDQGMSGYGRMAELLNDYDAGVFEADRGVGQVLDVLEATGRLEGALVMVTSDHGESFCDRGLHVGHGIGLTDDELRVPLVVRFPGGEAGGTRLDTPVDLLDLMPTALDVTGLASDPQLVGESLRQLARGEPRRRSYLFGVSQNTATFFLVRDGYKYITPLGLDPLDVVRRHLGPESPPVAAGDRSQTYTRGRGSNAVELRYDSGNADTGRLGDPLGLRDGLPQDEQLFDRRQDPGERNNLAGEMPERVARMRSFLEQVYRRSDQLNSELFDENVEVKEDPHERIQLLQLGYLDTGSRDALKRLPLRVRKALRNPYRAPDTTALEALDRAAHLVRLALQEGRLGPASAHADLEQARLALQDAGDGYVAWGLDHRRHWTRIPWRLFDLVGLAEQAGLVLDADRWVDLGQRGTPVGARDRKN